MNSGPLRRRSPHFGVVRAHNLIPCSLPPFSCSRTVHPAPRGRRSSTFIFKAAPMRAKLYVSVAIKARSRRSRKVVVGIDASSFRGLVKLNNRSGKSGGDSLLDTQTISARDATHPGAQNLNLTKRYRLWPSGSASSGRCTKLENANRWRNLSLEEASNCGPECDSAHYRSNPH